MFLTGGSIQYRIEIYRMPKQISNQNICAPYSENSN